jgi:hypothetical protein
MVSSLEVFQRVLVSQFRKATRALTRPHTPACVPEDQLDSCPELHSAARILNRDVSSARRKLADKRAEFVSGRCFIHDSAESIWKLAHEASISEGSL